MTEVTELPENPGIRTLRRWVIGCLTTGVLIFIATGILASFMSMNDPTGWSALGAAMIFLYTGFPAYLLGILLGAIYLIRMWINMGRYSNSYSTKSTVLLFINSLILLGAAILVVFTF